VVLLNINNQNQVVFYTIKGSSIRKFLIIEIVTGTGIYYALKLFSSSVLIAMIGSIVGIEGIKRTSLFSSKNSLN
jgi:hypothetical protein